MFILVGDVEVWLFWTEDGMEMSVFWVMVDASQVGDHQEWFARASLAECNSATVFRIDDRRGLIGKM
jgi:hypothetical protein